MINALYNKAMFLKVYIFTADNPILPFVQIFYIVPEKVGENIEHLLEKRDIIIKMFIESANNHIQENDRSQSINYKVKSISKIK